MKGPGHQVTGVDTFLESSLQSVDGAEQMALEVARQVGFPEDELHKISMAVREAVVNAVVHGNRYNANKRVHLEVAGEPDRMTVIVTDEGDGFDPSTLPDPLAEENLLHQSGRGILLIRAFVDEFSAAPASPAGTAVRMVKYLKRD
jgi:serine/threonine-protein kinase RsbW